MRSSSLCRPGAVACLGLMILLASSGCADSAPPIDGVQAGLEGPPVAVGPFLDGVFPTRTPNAVGSTTWSLSPAFPNLNLGNTLVISPNPSDNRLYVGDRDGLVRSFDNDQTVTSYDPFIDLRDRAWAVWDGGLLGLVFHPEFGQSGSPYEKYFYVYYSSHCSIEPRPDGTGYQTDLSSCDTSVPRGSTGGFFGAYNRLSRFEVDDFGVGDPTSEHVMINMRLYNGSHRGGGIIFRHEDYDIGGGQTETRRFLYLTIGDQFRFETAQDITGNLEGGVVRLAVDVLPDGNGWSCPPNSDFAPRVYSTSLGHAPEEFSGQWYCIPDDNPWAGVPDTFAEYCSLGHRNPHRLALDPVTNLMWSGEVGQNTREEINILECGNNYGWPFREGLTTGVRAEPPSYEGILTDPVIDFVRTEARAIIGGYVYRGSRYPQLLGRFIAGDYVTGNIWSITLDESTMTATKEYLTEFTPGGLGTFGQDNDGEVYLGDVINGTTLWQLDGDNQGVGDAPSLLSDLGAFDDLANLTPSPVWVPYDLNQPFWSDSAIKSRWVAVPNDGNRDTDSEKIGFVENGYWTYPTGTVIMKHFDLGLDESEPSITTRLETRFMVLGDDGIWYALTYRWLPNQLDAVLLTTGETADYTIQLAGGGARLQTWSFPSRLECMDCHRQESGGALGPRTHQLNGDAFYPSTGLTENQLVTWNDLGMFTPALDPAAIPSMPRARALGDVTASLEDRARAWLDSNCSSCHQPGTGIAGFDTRLWTPLASQGLIWGPVRDDLGIPGLSVITPGDPETSSISIRMDAVGQNAMPPLAKSLAQVPAVDLMGEWILRVDPGLPQNGLAYKYYETGTIDELADLVEPNVVRTGSVGTFDISIRSRDNDFGFRFTGYLQVQTGGDYTFFTNSDDGSQLFIDGGLVVDNGGLHAPFEASGVVTLVPGFYEIEVTMFERGGGQVLDVTWQGPDTGNAQEAIDPGRLFQGVPTPTPNAPPVLTSPGSQFSDVGDAVTLDLTVDDPDGDLLYFEATGLPTGLAIDAVSGQISGTTSAFGTTTCTVGVSDGPEVSWVEFDWTVDPPGGPFCGDGIVQAPEECDDGNNTNGDGCAAGCTLEVAPACGDGNLDAGEQCDDGNTLDGDGCSSVCTLEVAPACGDGVVEGAEQCDDGNLIDGDGCSASCQLEAAGQDLTYLGNVIASVTAPLGRGNKDLEVIRDGDLPAQGLSDTTRQYDTWDGKNTATEDWIGYAYSSDQVFGELLFQEGMHFFDGGWFDTLTVQVRQNGVWTDVSGLSIVPAYPGNNGISFEIFQITFAPAIGDAIRIYGTPGGIWSFISVAELYVFAPTIVSVCGDGIREGIEACDDGNTLDGDGCSSVCTLEVAPACGDGNLDAGEQCDDGNTLDGDGCSSVCTLEVAPACGDGNLDAGEQCDDGNTLDGDGCSSVCTLEVAPACGDGNLDAGEQCDDGNTLDGDGCSSVCTLEVAPACGDGNLDAGEQCDDGNTLDGDGCSSVCTLEVAPACGDGVVEGAEQCDDGNLIDGDGCSASCQLEAAGQDLTYLGNVIASVTAPLGRGNKDLEVIRDGDLPAQGLSDTTRQYDTWDGKNTATEDWIGYAYSSDQVFGELLFQEGMHFFDGGWFDTLTVQVRQNGVWTDVSGLSIVPAYPGNNGISFEIFQITFAPAIGDAIRIYGTPGGIWSFISVAELYVFAPTIVSVCGDGIREGIEACDDGNTLDGDGCSSVCTLEVAPACGDGNLDAGEQCDDGNTLDGDGCSSVCTLEVAPACGDGNLDAGEQCDDGNTLDGDGCSSVCTLEVAPACGDGNLDAGEQCDDGNTLDGDGCSSVCTLEVAPACGDGNLDAGEQCDDGNTLDGDGCSASCQLETAGQDLTYLGSIIASVTAPLGTGNKDLEVIRDGDLPAVGSSDKKRQYDTWDGKNTATEDWIGYAYSSDQVFGELLFQEGMHFFDGGWFDTLTVQVRQNGVWTDVSGLSIVPVYPGNNGVTFETFQMTFVPAIGDAIRIYGTPGGIWSFISVAELYVFGPSL